MQEQVAEELQPTAGQETVKRWPSNLLPGLSVGGPGTTTKALPTDDRTSTSGIDSIELLITLPRKAWPNMHIVQ